MLNQTSDADDNNKYKYDTQNKVQFKDNYVQCQHLSLMTTVYLLIMLSHQHIFQVHLTLFSNCECFVKNSLRKMGLQT